LMDFSLKEITKQDSKNLNLGGASSFQVLLFVKFNCY